MEALVFIMVATTVGLLAFSPVVLLTGLLETWANKPEPPRPFNRSANKFNI